MPDNKDYILVDLLPKEPKLGQYFCARSTRVVPAAQLNRAFERGWTTISIIPWIEGSGYLVYLRFDGITR